MAPSVGAGQTRMANISEATFWTGLVATSEDINFDSRRADATTTTKPVVLMVHGMWCRPHVWDKIRTFFATRGYHVLTPALRHHDCEPGQAPHPELGHTSLRDYADDLEVLIRSLKERPFVIGHSMGGTLMQMLAARDLIKAGIGLAPAQCAGPINLDPRSMWIFKREFFMSRFWRKPQLPSFDAMCYGVLNGLPEHDRKPLYDTLIPDSGRALLEIGYWFVDRQRTTWIDPKAVTAPMLFMTGGRDRITPAWVAKRVVANYGDNVRLEILPDHAHWLPAEQGWENLAQRCVDFFESDAARQRPDTGAFQSARDRVLSAA